MSLAEQLKYQLSLRGKIKVEYNDAPEYGNVNDIPSTNTYNKQHVQEWDSFDVSDDEENMYGNINPNDNEYGNIGQEQFTHTHNQAPPSIDTQKNNWLHQPPPDIPPSRGGPGFPHPSVSQTGSSHDPQFQRPPFSKTNQGIRNQSRFAPTPVNSQVELFPQSQKSFQHQGFQPSQDNFEDNSNDTSQQPGGPGFPHPPVSQTGYSHESQQFQRPPFSKTNQGILNQSRFAPPPVTSQVESFPQSQKSFQHQGFQPSQDNFENDSNDTSQQPFKPQGFKLPPFPQQSKNNFNEYPRDNFEVNSNDPSQQNFKPKGFQLSLFSQPPNSNSSQYHRNNFETNASGPSQKNFKPQGFQLPKHSQSSSNQDSRSFLPPPNDSETDSFNRFQRNIKPPTSQPPVIPKFPQDNSNQDNSQIESFSQRNIKFPQPPVDVFPRNQPPQQNLNKELARKFPQQPPQSDTTSGGLPRPPRNGKFFPLPLPGVDPVPFSGRTGTSDPRSQNEFNPPSKFNPRQPLPAPPDSNTEQPRSHINFDTRQALPIPPDLENEQLRFQPPIHFDPRQILPAPTNYNNEPPRSESNFKLQSTKNINSRSPASIPSQSNNEHLHPSNKGQPRGQQELSLTSQSYKPNPFQTVQTPTSEENDSKFWDFTTAPYFKMIGRKGTENLIINKSNGTFILRPSTRADNLCTLSIVYKSNVIHISVQTRVSGKIGLGSEKVDENTFTNISEMVDYYKTNQMVLYTDGKDIESTRLTPYTY